ncbi:MAG: HAD family hydrolase [Ruminococcus sp.]|nr:HAD family hydrolase [Ruminococcus sp.]
MKPEMILFDFGGTLACDPIYNMEEGNSAIFLYITENPHNVTKEQFSNFIKELFDEIRVLRGEFIELHEHIFLRYVLEYFDIKLSIPIEEAEWIICKSLAENIMTPGADKMLKTLTEKGIRTGIVSNLCWSGAALERAMGELFPEHKFDFIITSSEYIFRKPDRHIFDMAIRKSGLKPEEIWFCGNFIDVDIIGAKNAGLFPVLYDNRDIPDRFHKLNDISKIDFPFHHISGWGELIEILENEKFPR